MRKSKEKKLNAVERILFSSNDHRDVRYKFFNDLNEDEIFKCLPIALKHRHFNDLKFIGEYFFTQNQYKIIIPLSDKNKSLSTMLSVLNLHSDALNELSEVEHKITASILSGDYSTAHISTDSFRVKYGMSLWYITLKCAIYDLEEKAKEKQDFIQTILANDIGRYASYIVKNSSSRLDTSGLFHDTSNSLKRALRGLDHYSGNHLLFRLTPLDFGFEYNFTDILNCEKNSNAIDMYKTLLNILLLKTFDANDDYLNYSSLISSHLSRVNCAPVNIIGYREYSLRSLYQAGKYSELISLNELEAELFNNFNNFYIYLKAIIKAKQKVEFNGLLNVISEKLTDILLKNKNYNKSLDYLYSLSFSFFELPWFKSLFIVISKEKEYINNRHKYCNLISTLSPSPNVANLSKYGDVRIPSSELAPNEMNTPLKMTQDITLLAKDMLNNGLIIDAIKMLESNIDKHDPLTNNELASLLVSTYLYIGKTIEAIEFCTPRILENINMLQIFPTQELYSEIKSKINNLNGILVPIFLSLHNRFVGDDSLSVLRYSLEHFLNQIDVKNGKEFIEKTADFNQSFSLYFMEYVFTPANMKLSLLFSGTDDINSNRFDICNYILSVTSKNEQIQEELKSLAKSEVLKKATKQIDNSRIYSDTAKLKSPTLSIFAELYEKYIELNKGDYSDFDDEKKLTKLIEIILKKGHEIINEVENETTVGDLFGGVFLHDIINNEKNDTFIRLLNLIRDEFVFGSNGLNSNLSTRIRHGHFPNTLRRSLLSEKLITTQTNTSSTFKVNEYWPPLLSVTKASNRQKIEQSFSDFHKEIESHIHEVNDFWLQINVLTIELNDIMPSDFKHSALFDFSISNVVSLYIQKHVASFSSYSDFIRSITDWLWERTNRSLIKIRKKITSELRLKVFESLKKLQTNINEATIKDDSFIDFNNSIAKCKEALGNDIETIASWFKKDEVEKIDDYDFDTLIDITERAVSINVDRSTTVHEKLIGKSLPYFVNVLYIIFENALSKSLLSKENLRISLSMSKENDDTYILKVTNNTKTIQSITESNNQLLSYKAKYGEAASYLKGAQVEGNSGILKIAKTLSQDLQLKHACDFGYISNNEFEIKIVFYDFNKALA